MQLFWHENNSHNHHCSNKCHSQDENLFLKKEELKIAELKIGF